VSEVQYDSAGVAWRDTPLRDVKPGDEIVGGWMPWSVVERVEIDGDKGRVYYTTHGPTDWFPLAQLFPVAA
jgi:hypothetical protein